MTTENQKMKLLDRLEENKKEGISEDSISRNLDHFIDYLIRSGFAKWIPTGDHDNLVLTDMYDRKKI